MKPRDLIAIVLIGTSLIAVAPTTEKAGQADRDREPAQDVNVTPARKDDAGDAKLQPASFTSDTEGLKTTATDR
ncbi:MAG: hypothetical protein AB7F09_16420 [Parvibaculaceae bacterium]